MAAGAGAPDGGPEGPNRGGGGAFACNLCLEPARDAVIGRCGHLYCWPCLHQWLLTRACCAVCGAAISRDTVVPLYGRDSARRDPRLETPPRPRGQRPEPESRGVPPTGPSSGFHVAFGFGAFPFAFFSTAPQPPPRRHRGCWGPPPGLAGLHLPLHRCRLLPLAAQRLTPGGAKWGWGAPGLPGTPPDAAGALGPPSGFAPHKL